MSKEYIAKTLKRLRENTGLTSDDVGTLIGKSGKTVNAWENGRGQPDAEILIKLCSIYKVDNLLAEFDENNIINTNISQNEMAYINKCRKLDRYGRKAVTDLIDNEYSRCIEQEQEQANKMDTPVISIRHSYYKVSAGKGFELGDGDSWGTIEVPDTPEARKADYALTIKGRSMEPIYFNGDIVLIKKQPAVDIGQVGIFVLNGAGYIKKFGGDRLISLNDEYDDIVPGENDDCQCVGKVIGRA